MNDKAVINQCVVEHCSSIITDESHGDNNCPACDSEETEGAFITIEGKYAYQGMICLACEESWTDVYKFEYAIRQENI